MADQTNPAQTKVQSSSLAATVSAPPVEVHLMPADPRPPSDRGAVPLWIAIRNRRLDYNAYSRFINLVLCEKGPPPGGPDHSHYKAAMATLRTNAPNASSQCGLGWVGHGMNSYDLLKTATEVFLLLECGVFIATYHDPPTAPNTPNDVIPGAETSRVSGNVADASVLQAALSKYLGANKLPYIERVVKQTFGSDDFAKVMHDFPFCEGVLASRVSCPCFLELIWSYWHEEGMLVQGLNAISMRFQNRRISDGRDPLAQLELSPLRPLSSIFWGYVQDEQHRLSLSRRNYEYEHEYGIGLRGKAVPSSMRIADRRSKFIEAFHDLLYRCAQYYTQSANLQYNPDPFPLLNGLKEVHLILSQGAGNQFGDLPWTARVEMLMQQWILARPEIREFLGRRPMVAYPEDWMGAAESMKTLMGWSDTSIVHFRNLATFGEQLLLSIRWHAWGNENDPMAARDWAAYWRPEIQGYMHAYRVATAVDLSAEPKDSTAIAKRNESPSALLEARLGEQRTNGSR
jgi:hypothetical protein